MTTPSFITITSVITPNISEGGEQTLNESWGGITEYKGEYRRISYECKEIDSTYSTQITFSTKERNRLYVRRHGDISSDMLFEVGHTHAFLYSVSTYSFDASITTTSLLISDDSENGDINISVKYLLTVGNETSVCEMHIKSEEKDG